MVCSELMTLCCGVLFFLAFFVAMYVEVKAKNTVYQVIDDLILYYSPKNTVYQVINSRPSFVLWFKKYSLSGNSRPNFALYSKKNNYNEAVVLNTMY